MIKHSPCLRRNLCVFLFISLGTISMSSCYSVRLVNKNGTAVPDLTNMEEGFHRHKKVVTVDTTVKLNFTQGKFMLVEDCDSGGFHSIEYRVGFGHVFLSAITLGRVKKVKLRYTCLQTDDN